MNPDDDLQLPPEPERPDCCNGGCAVCVLDGFDEEMDAWRQACRAIRAKQAQRLAVAPSSPPGPGPV